MSTMCTVDVENLLLRHQENFRRLVKLELLVPKLNKHRLLTFDESNSLLDDSVPNGKRNIQLATILTSKGAKVFPNFLTALSEATEHSGHERLLELLSAPEQGLWFIDLGREGTVALTYFHNYNSPSVELYCYCHYLIVVHCTLLASCDHALASCDFLHDCSTGWDWKASEKQMTDSVVILGTCMYALLPH